MFEKLTYEELEQRIRELEHAESNRKQAEDALLENLERMKYAEEIVGLGFWDWNVVTGNLYWSDQAYIHYGFESQEFVPTYEKFSNNIHPDDLSFVQRNINDALQNKATYDIEFRFVRPNDEIRYLHTKGDVTRDNAGNAVRFAGAQIDITKYKQAEKVLKKKTYDLGERVKELNCLYGISKLVETHSSPEEIYQGIVDIIPPSWQYPEITCSRIILNDKEYKTKNFKETPWKQYSNIYVHKKHVGILQIYYLEKKPEIDEGPFLKEERYLIKAITERLGHIIERQQMEEALQRAHDYLEKRVNERTMELKEVNKKLESANKELSQYAYVAAHDLKAPLRAIRNYSDFLLEDLEEELDGDHKEYLDGLNRAVGQGEELINGLLTLTRIDRSEDALKVIDLNAFINELAESMKLPDNVELLLSDDLPAIKADKILLSQIFRNLIDNAIKFNKSQAKCVRIGRSDIGEGNVEIFVHDNGVGIETRFFDKIFQVFQRLHTSNEYEGTGIGLAIVNKAADKLGGGIRIESEPGKGSKFFINIPHPKKGVK